MSIRGNSEQSLTSHARCLYVVSFVETRSIVFDHEVGSSRRLGQSVACKQVDCLHCVPISGVHITPIVSIEAPLADNALSLVLIGHELVVV